MLTQAPIHFHAGSAGPASVRLVTNLLTTKSLPVELAQRIIDLAQYWTRCSRSSSRSCTIVAGLDAAKQTSGGQLEAWVSGQDDDVRREMGEAGGKVEVGKGEAWYLCSMRIGCISPEREGVRAEGQSEDGSASWLRGIRVEVFSREKGWSACPISKESVMHRHSWFEVSLLRNGVEVGGSRIKIEHNPPGQNLNYHQTDQRLNHHQSVLGHKHPLVKLAEEGDRVVLWGKADCPGWTRHIKQATISLYTAPFPSSP